MQDTRIKPVSSISWFEKSPVNKNQAKVHKKIHKYAKMKEIGEKRDRKKRRGMWIPKNSLTIAAEPRRVIMSFATVLEAMSFSSVIREFTIKNVHSFRLWNRLNLFARWERFYFGFRRSTCERNELNNCFGKGEMMAIN